ncbi:MAG: hypothetical protein ABIJ15_06285, partial [bacterium]
MKKIIGIILTAVMVTAVPANAALADPEWWDPDAVGAGDDWHYRLTITVSAGLYDRYDCPVIYELDFNDLLNRLGVTGTFDVNSPRVVEVTSIGTVLGERKSWFEAPVFISSVNARGHLIWNFNGISPAGAVRYYNIYFDIAENGSKAAPSYRVSTAVTSLSNGTISIENISSQMSFSNLIYNATDYIVSDCIKVSLEDANEDYSSHQNPAFLANDGAFPYDMGVSSRVINESDFKIVRGWVSPDNHLFIRQLYIMTSGKSFIRANFIDNTLSSDYEEVRFFNYIDSNFAGESSGDDQVKYTANLIYSRDATPGTHFGFMSNLLPSKYCAQCTSYTPGKLLANNIQPSKRQDRKEDIDAAMQWNFDGGVYSLLPATSTTMLMEAQAVGTIGEIKNTLNNLTDLPAVSTTALEGFGIDITLPVAGNIYDTWESLSLSADSDAGQYLCTNSSNTMEGQLEKFTTYWYGMGEVHLQSAGDETYTYSYDIPAGEVGTQDWRLRVWPGMSDSSPVYDNGYVTVDTVTFKVGSFDIHNFDADVSSNIMSLSVNPGNSKSGSFVIENTGGSGIDNIIFYSSELTKSGITISTSNITFSPATVANLNPGSVNTIQMTVAVPANQPPGVYSSSVTSCDDDGTPSDIFLLALTVNSVEDVDVQDNAGDVTASIMTLSGDSGADRNGTFVVENTGNVDLTAVTFSCADLYDGSGSTITAANISFDVSGSTFIASLPFQVSVNTRTVILTVSIPDGQKAATYSGSVTAEDDDGAPFDVFTVRVVVSATEALRNKDNDGGVTASTMSLTGIHATSQSGYFFIENYGNINLNNILFSADDLSDGAGHTIPGANITFMPNIVANLNFEAGSNTASIKLTVSIPAGQSTGTYSGYITLEDDDLIPSDNFLCEVIVSSSEALDVLNNWGNVSGNLMTLMEEPSASATGYFKIENTGNVALTDLEFNSSELYNGTGGTITASNVIFTPGTVASLDFAAGSDTQTIALCVNIPIGQSSGTYTGTVTALDDDSDPSDTFSLEVIVSTGSEKIDIRNNDGDLSGNVMTFSVDASSSGSGIFIIDNTGTAEVGGLEFSSTELLDSYGHAISTGNISYSPVSVGAFGVSESTTILLTVNVDAGQPAGAYQATVSAENEGYPADFFILSVTVNADENLEVFNDSAGVTGNIMSLLGDPFSSPSGSFTVINNGNIDINNIQFNSTALSDTGDNIPSAQIVFDINPLANLSFLAGSNTQTVNLTVNIPDEQAAGTYTGTITAKDDDGSPSDTFGLKVTVNSKEDIDVQNNGADMAANELTLTGNPQTSQTGNFIVENTGNVVFSQIQFYKAELYNGTGSTITVDKISFDYSGSTVIATLPYTTGSDEAIVQLTVSISSAQPAGTYTGTVSVKDSDGDPSDTFSLKVIVNQKEDLDIQDDAGGLAASIMTLSGNPGTSQSGNFKVENTGNVLLDDIIYASTIMDDGGSNNIGTAYITFIPAGTASLDFETGSDIVSSTVTVDIPSEQAPGLYSGVVTAKDDDDTPSDTFITRLTVNGVEDIAVQNNYLDIIASSMTLSGAPGATVTGDFGIENTGNISLGNVIFSASLLEDGAGSISTSVIVFTPGLIANLNYKAGSDKQDIEISISIPAAQPPGIYVSTITVKDDDGTPSSAFLLKLTVNDYENLNVHNNDMDVWGNEMHITGAFGESATGYFLLENTGNMDLTGIEFISADLEHGTLVDALGDPITIAAGDVDFVPVSGVLDLSYAAGSDTQAVLITVDLSGVPNTEAGIYSGIITVRDDVDGPADTFALFVNVTGDESIDIHNNDRDVSGGVLTINGVLGSVATGYFVLENTGISTAENIVVFNTGDLDDGAGHKILASNIKFDPDYTFSLGVGSTQTIAVGITSPVLQYPATYYSVIMAQDDDGTPSDSVILKVIIGNYEALDIHDNEKDISSGIMSLSGNPDTSQNGDFVIENTGNCALNNIEFVPASLSDGAGHTISPDNIIFDINPIAALPSEIGFNLKQINLTVNIPDSQAAGIYTSTVTARDDDGDPEDTFILSVTVAGSEDIDVQNNGGDVVSNTLSLSGDPDSNDSGNFIVENTGNITLTDIQFSATGLSGAGALSISSSNVSFNPVTIETLSYETGSATTSVTLTVGIPPDQGAGSYQGTISVKDDDGTPQDTFGIKVVVNAVEVIDIHNNDADVSGNMLDLTGYPLDISSGSFILENKSNVDLTDVQFVSSVLSDGSGHNIPAGSISFNPGSISNFDYESGRDTASVRLTVTIPGNQNPGIYIGTVQARDDDGTPSDSFTLRVTVQGSESLDVRDNSLNLVSNTLSISGNPLTTPYGYFLVENDGNIQLTNIALTAVALSGSGGTIPSSEIFFVPASISNLDYETGSDTTAVKLSVSIPEKQYPGVYFSTVTVQDDDGDPSDTFFFNLTVNTQEGLNVLNNTGDVSGNVMSLGGGPGSSQEGIFYADNTGNVDLDGVNFISSNLTSAVSTITAANISFSTSAAYINYESGNSTISVTLTLNIPSGQAAGFYTGVILVRDDDLSPEDTFSIAVTVNPSENMDVQESSVTLSGAPGQNRTGSVIIENTGNVDLNDIEFSASSFNGGMISSAVITFSPGSIANLDYESGLGTTSVQITVAIPGGQPPGVYVSTVTVRDDDLTPSDTFFIYLTVSGVDGLDVHDNGGDLSGNLLSVSGNSGAVSSSGTFVTANTGNTTLSGIIFSTSNFISGANIITREKISFSSSTLTLLVGSSSSVKMSVNIPSGQPPGIYTSSVTVQDVAGTPSDSFSVELTVNSAEGLDVQESSITLSGLPGQNRTGSVIIENTGNVDLNDIEFSASSFNGGLIPASAVSFSPGSIANLDYETGSDTTPVQITVSIPDSQAPGLYISTVTVRDDDLTPSDTFFIYLTVNSTGILNIRNNDVEISTPRVCGNLLTLYGSVGETTTGYFRIENAGNVDFTGVNFAGSDLVTGSGSGLIASSSVTFTPSSLAGLDYETGIDTKTITVCVYISSGAGLYEGTVIAGGNWNSNTSSDTFTLQVAVSDPNESFSILSSSKDVDSDRIMTLTGNCGFVSSSGTFAIGNSGAVLIDSISFISTALEDSEGHSISSDSVVFSTSPLSNLAQGATEYINLSVNIPSLQARATYYATITASDDDGSPADNFTLKLIVEPTEGLNVCDNYSQGSVSQSTMTLAGDPGSLVSGEFVVENTGNITLDGIEFSASDFNGGAISFSVISFVPAGIDSLSFEGSSTTVVQVKVNISSTQSAGIYISTVNVRDDDLSPDDTFYIRLTVNSVEDISLNVSSVTVAGDPNFASSLGTFTVTNSGNVSLDNIVFSTSNLISGSNSIPGHLITFSTGGFSLVIGLSTSVRVGVSAIPDEQPAGTYLGSVVVSTGGPMQETFTLRCTVNEDKNIDVDDNALNVNQSTMTLSGAPASSAAGDFLVRNNGNVNLTNIIFEVTDFQGAGITISSTAVTFSPSGVGNLPYETGNDTVSVRMSVAIPSGKEAGLYVSTVTVKDGSLSACDTFFIRLNVTAAENLSLDVSSVTVRGAPGFTSSLGTFTVTNSGNISLSNIIFSTNNLVSGSNFIEGNLISFSTGGFSLEISSSISVKVSVSISSSQPAGTYLGSVVVKDDDDSPQKTFTLRCTVNEDKNIDVDDNALNVNQSTMSISGAPVSSASGDFLVRNIGNVNLTDINFEVNEFLSSGSAVISSNTVTFSPAGIGYLSYVTGNDTVAVRMSVAIPSGKEAGLYVSTVTVKDGSLSACDTFFIRLNVTAAEKLSLDISSVTVSGDPGVVSSSGTFTVTNSGNISLSNIIFSTNALISGSNSIQGHLISFSTGGFSLGISSGISVKVSVSNIPASQPAGTYLGNVVVKDDDGAPQETFTLRCTVNEDRNIDVDDNALNVNQSTMTVSGAPSSSASGDFLVRNNGNVNLTDIIFEVNDFQGTGPSISSNTVTFSPSGIGVISYETGSDTVAVRMSVAIPSGQDEGLYVSTVTVKDGGLLACDTFFVRLTVTADEGLDVHNNELSISSNVLVINGEPGDFKSGCFIIENTGNIALTGIIFSTGPLTSGANTIPGEQISFSTSSFNLQKGLTACATLYLNIPAGQALGTYLATITVKHDDGTPQDTFVLEVNVNTEAVDIHDNGGTVSANIMSLSGNPGNSVSGNFIIENTGSVALDNLVLVSTHLRSGSYTIPSSTISFTPSSVTILDFQESSTNTISVQLNVYIPVGQPAGIYTSTVAVVDDDGQPSDTFTLRLTVNQMPGLDIQDNSPDLSSGTMSLTGNRDTVLSGSFILENTGNINLDNIVFISTDLGSPSGTILSTDISFSTGTASTAAIDLAFGATVAVRISVDVSSAQPYGLYSGTITVMDDDGSPSDSFFLMVDISDEKFSMFHYVDGSTVTLSTMTLSGFAGNISSGTFFLENNGSVLLDNIEF